MLSSNDSEDYVDYSKETMQAKAARLRQVEADEFERDWERNQTIAPFPHDLPVDNLQAIHRFTDLAKEGIRALELKQRAKKLDAGTPAEQLMADPPDLDTEIHMPTSPEGMLEQILQMQNMVEDKFGFRRQEDERLQKEQSLQPTHSEDPEHSASDPLEQDEILTDEFTGMTFNMSKSEDELLAQLGVFEIPEATEQDFEQMESSAMPTANSALEAWDLFKGKDEEGFDTVCMRHRRWGSEIELFIGSSGRLKLRPTARHGVQHLLADGTWLDLSLGAWRFDAEHLFQHLRAHPGCGWLEAMGGADDWIIEGNEPRVPDGVEEVDMGRVRSRRGWTPAQDRFSDVDVFNTTYLRPSRAKGWEDEAWVCQAMAPMEGFWTAREWGDKVVWRNSVGLCELWLTAEGAYYLGAEEAQMVEPPQAVRVEFGLGGCVGGETRCFAMSLRDARGRLGLPDGGEVRELEGEEEGGVRARLRAWTGLHGWHDLRGRLLDRGVDAWMALRSIKREWEHELGVQLATEVALPEPVEDNIYVVRGRRVQLREWSEDGMPGTMEDVETGARIWSIDQPFQHAFPWAAEGLRVSNSDGITRVVEVASGEVLAEFEEAPWDE